MGAAMVEVPREYGYVVLVFISYGLLDSWMSYQVFNARYKVPYPTLYAVESENKDAKLFNCVQRGHQNSMETLPLFLASLLVGGIRHPLISAGLGAFYTFTRFFHFRGYATGIPSNRLKIGVLSFPAIFGFMACNASFRISLLRG